MSAHPHLHVHMHPEYAPPVLRAPSPTSSVGTTYGPDQTSLSDSEQVLSQAAFERKCAEKLNLHGERRGAYVDDVARVEGVDGITEWDWEGWPKVRKGETKEENQVIADKLLQNLRAKVAQLDEDELFEQTLLRGSQIGFETGPSTTDIDALMRSMMGLPPSLDTNPTGPDSYETVTANPQTDRAPKKLPPGLNTKIFGRAANAPLSDGPWIKRGAPGLQGKVYEDNSVLDISMESILASVTGTSTVGKHGSRGDKLRRAV